VNRRFVVAITGASGAVYGRRLLDVLSDTGSTIHLVVSEPATRVIAHELGIHVDPAEPLPALLGRTPPNVTVHAPKDLEVAIASGSYRHDGMVVCPCSGGTLARIATGASTNLIERAADVCLKERRKLIVVPRETPLSSIHLENMLKLTHAGAIVLPASPGFYSERDSVDRLVDFVVARILDHLGVENGLMQRYGEPAQKRHPEDEV
jgi:flavin prenyltransferase